MLTTIDILEFLRARVKENTGSDTDYRIAKELGCGHSSVHRWCNGHSLEAKYALKIGEYLGIDPRHLVACVEAEKAAKRQDIETADFWAGLAADFEPATLPERARAA